MGRPKLGIERVNIGLDPRLTKLYTKLAERSGVSMSELVREAMDQHARRVLLPKYRTDQAFSELLDKALELEAQS